MPRLKLHLAYTGTHFSGWQIQNNARTVQGTLEWAISRITNRYLRVYGAGRTDAGVHALDQVAHCDIPRDKVHVAWKRALNSFLPSDIAVTGAEWAPPEFHSRISAQSKIYSYTLWVHPEYVLPQRSPYVWPVKHLDLEEMQRAKDIFVGKQDFAAFQNAGSNVENTVRTVYWIKEQPGIYTDKESVWEFSANGFLKQMVRNLMGALVELGRGKLTRAELEDILKSGDRRLASPTAPARGLSLDKIKYSRRLNFARR